MESHSATVADRDKGMLVVVDIQERLASAMPERERVLSATGLLVRSAAIAGLPILVTRQYPRGLGELEPAVLEVLDEAREQGAHVESVDKLSFDCFAEPAFSAIAEKFGRRQLIVCGMESHICVTQTALAGLARGFDVHVVADASCSRDSRNHDLALMRLAHAGAVPTSAESVAYELIGCAGTEEFKRLLAAVKARDV